MNEAEEFPKPIVHDAVIAIFKNLNPKIGSSDWLIMDFASYNQVYTHAHEIKRKRNLYGISTSRAPLTAVLDLIFMAE